VGNRIETISIAHHRRANQLALAVKSRGAHAVLTLRIDAAGTGRLIYAAHVWCFFAASSSSITQAVLRAMFHRMRHSVVLLPQPVCPAVERGDSLRPTRLHC